jgi:hypothetical protein
MTKFKYKKRLNNKEDKVDVNDTNNMLSIIKIFDFHYPLYSKN